MPGLMIADDEAIVRAALSRMIAQTLPELSPILEASSGEEAISLAREICPEIVLMDVKMPGLSGLQAAGAIRRDCPSTKVIMLTAYDEFSFAQEALRLGVVDYLLKPVRPGLLLEVLGRVQRQIQEEENHRIADEEASSLLRETLPLVEARLVQDLASGRSDANTPVDRMLAHLGKSLKCPAVMVLKVDNYESMARDMTTERLDRLERLLADILQRVLPAPNRALIGQVQPGTLAVIVSTDPNDKDLKQVRALGHAIRYAVESGAPVTATIGIGNSYEDLDLIPLSYSEAVRAQLHEPYLSTNCVIHIADVPKAEAGPRPAYPVELERELIRAIQSGEHQDAQEPFKRIIDHLLAQSYQPLETVRTRLVELMALVSRAVIEAGAPAAEVLGLSHAQTAALERLKTTDDVRGWALNSLAALLARVETRDPGNTLVNQAMEYMRENLHRPGLELKDVARSVNLSNSHLAHLLKARCGTSYVKYLTQLRIEEARKLLSTTDLTIAAVSVAVGYEDATYFHRVFRRETAMTPSTFRQTRRSGKQLTLAPNREGTADTSG
jgi:two-component system, response regulator YesN